VQQNQFPEAGTVDRIDAAQVEHYFASILKQLRNQLRKRQRLVTIDNTAMAMNHHDIAAIPSFETKFQLQLLR
jgi:hypothetical protein